VAVCARSVARVVFEEGGARVALVQGGGTESGGRSVSWEASRWVSEGLGAMGGGGVEVPGGHCGEDCCLCFVRW